MKKKIRLYKRHDMDLLALYKNPEFNFQYVVHEALKAYVRGKPYFIYVPRCDKDLANYEFKSIYQFSIDLNPETEADVIEWIENAQNSYQNALIKSVLRGCLVGTSAFACVRDDNDRIRANGIIEMAKNKLVVSDAPVKKKRKTSKKNKTENNVVRNNSNMHKGTQQSSASSTLFTTESQSATSYVNTQPAGSIRNYDESVAVSNADNEGKNIRNHESDAAILSSANMPTASLRENKSDVISSPVNQNSAPQDHAVEQKTGASVPMQAVNADDFDLSGFGSEDTVENGSETENGSFDLFGDITNMLKNF